MFADVVKNPKNVDPFFPGVFLGPGKNVRFSGVSMKNFMKATEKKENAVWIRWIHAAYSKILKFPF